MLLVPNQKVNTFFKHMKLRTKLDNSGNTCYLRNYKTEYFYYISTHSCKYHFGIGLGPPQLPPQLECTQFHIMGQVK